MVFFLIWRTFFPFIFLFSFNNFCFYIFQKAQLSRSHQAETSGGGGGGGGGHNAEDSSVYPPEELEWLATTAFNRAVDFYCASDDDGCKRWAEKALTLAGLLDQSAGRREDDEEASLAAEGRGSGGGGGRGNGGAGSGQQSAWQRTSLHELLQSKYLGLNWGG